MPEQHGYDEEEKLVEEAKMTPKEAIKLLTHTSTDRDITEALAVLTALAEENERLKAGLWQSENELGNLKDALRTCALHGVELTGKRKEKGETITARKWIEQLRSKRAKIK